MDVARPIEARTAGRVAASGTRFTPFNKRTSITPATLARDWHEVGVVPSIRFGPFGSFGSAAAGGVSNGPRVGYRDPHRPSATGDGRAS